MSVGGIGFHANVVLVETYTEGHILDKPEILERSNVWPLY